ncbi:helix-turn-helix domain-containing protein [Cellulosimicrobium funkei]|uniref:helix-turn-helix domain-containing protein n=1 Tax=Cellulosimicrobium funkei TaxID=264251 RepID=UPI0036CAB7BA
MTPRRLVPLATAADLADVSVKTLRRRIAEGQLRAYRVGALIKVDPADLERIILPIGRAA